MNISEIESSLLQTIIQPDFLHIYAILADAISSTNYACKLNTIIMHKIHKCNNGFKY